MMVIFFIYLAFIVLLVVSLWKIFVKAGRPGWESLIPFYNFYIQCEFTGVKNWWLIFIPFVNIYIAIKSVLALAKSFGKDIGFAIGLIFLGFIFYPILGLGDAKYIGPDGQPINKDDLLSSLQNQY